MSRDVYGAPVRSETRVDSSPEVDDVPRRYESLLRVTEDAVYRLAGDGTIVHANAHLLSLTGYDSDTLVGKHVSHLLADGDARDGIPPELAVSDPDTVTTTETRLESAADTPIPVRIRTTAVETDADRNGVLGCVTETADRTGTSELGRRLEQQRITARLGEYALEGDTSLDDLFDRAVTDVASALDADYCKVLDLLPSDEELLLRSGVGWREGIVGSAIIPAHDDGSQAGHTLASRTPIVVPDFDAETRFDGPELLVSHGVRSGISTVIGARDDPWGILGVHDTEKQEFDENDVEFIENVANILATAIARRRNETVLSEREQTLKRAYEIVSTPEESFAEKLDRLLPFVQETIGTGFASLSRLNRDTGRYVFEHVNSPEDSDLEPGDEVPLEATNCEVVAETGRPLAVDDVETDRPELAGRAGNSEWGISCYLGAPVLVDRELYGTFCFYDLEPREDGFTDWQVTFVELLSKWIGTELERADTFEELNAVNDLSAVVRDINRAIVEQSTRREIEQTVCDRLASVDSYAFAWTGRLPARTDTVEPVASANAGTYLDDITITVDADDPASDGPTATAITSGETQVVRDIDTAPEYDPWRDHAADRDVAASAAIPITYEGTTYGVLNLYTERKNAFADTERDVVGQLGRTMGHAINAIERRDALTSDAVVELDFVVPDVFQEFGESFPDTGSVTLTGAEEAGGNTFYVFGVATGDAVDSLDRVAGTVPHFDAPEIVSEDEDEDAVKFRVRLDDPPILTEIAKHGGRIRTAVVDGGEYVMTVEIPPAVDTRRITEVVQDVHPTAEMRAQRQTKRDTVPAESVQSSFVEGLTDRQRTAVKLAYRSGFFEWPRDTTGEEVADLMDISPATFHQHLRLGQEQILAALLDGGATPADE